MREKEFAPGIYDKNRFESIPTFSDPQIWESVIHRHDAFKAGRHYDLRLLQPGTDNLHSWALRRMPKPGEKVLAVQQPTHAANYIDFKGVIPQGYGAGPVNIQSRKKAIVLRSSPDRITFQLGPGLYTLVKIHGKDGRSWLLINRTQVPYVQKKAGAGVGAGPNDIVGMVLAKKLKGTRFQKTIEEMRNAWKRPTF